MDIGAQQKSTLTGLEGASIQAVQIEVEVYFATHPGGTVKAGELVDSNLRTEYENLYVCDCSVIPEAWGLPTPSAIIGLGKRLAKHLSGEVKS